MNLMTSSYLRNLTIFQSVEERQLGHIAALAKIRQYRQGGIINYGSGSYSKIFFVITGKIKVTVQDIDEELVKDVVKEGEIFGDLELEGNPEAFECGQVLTENTIVCYLSTSDFIRILNTYPQVAIAFAKMINAKLKDLHDRHSDLMLRDVRSRLVRFIKNWALVEGSNMGDKKMLNNYLTHNDIAGMISSSRQTVSVLFKELKDSGLLHYNRKLIQLNDSEKWRQAV